MDKKVIIGNIGKDIESKQSKAGVGYGVFSVAVQLPKRGGQEKAETRWYDCMLFGNSNLHQFLKKGAKVYVEGSDSVNVSEQGKVFYNLLVDKVQVIVFAKESETEAMPEHVKTGFVKNTILEPQDDLPF